MVAENQTQFLDFHNILVNEVSGNILIFLALSIIVILILAVKFKFDNLTTLMILAVWIVIMSPFIGVLLPITLAVIGFFVASQLNRLTTR